MQPTDVVINQTAGTWTAVQVTGPNGGSINGYYSMNTNGSFYWQAVGNEPNGRCSASASGTTSSLASSNPQQTADTAVRNFIASIYNVMALIPST